MLTTYTLQPSESPTATPSFPPSTSTYPTISSSTQPSQYPTSEEEALLPPLTDSVIIEHASSDSNTTPILIVGAACFLVLASTTVYLHRKGNEPSSSGSGTKRFGSSRGGEKLQQSHDHGGLVVSPVSIEERNNGFTKGLSGTFDGVTFSKSEETIDYDYSGNKHTTTNIVQEENDMVDIDLEAGEAERIHTSSGVPNSVAFNVDEQCDIELSNTYDWSVMSSSVLARMPAIYIPKLFQRTASSTSTKNDEENKTTTNKKKLPTWNEIREEGIGQSSSGSSGFAPTSPVISPFKVRGLSSMLSPYGSKKRGIALVNEEDEDVSSVSLGNNVTTTTSTKSITRKSAWTRKGGMMALVDEDMESSVRGGEANRSRRAAWSSKKRSMMMMKSPVKEMTIEMESPSPDVFTNLEDPVDGDERKIQKTSSSNSNGSSIEWGIDVSNIKPADKATFDQNMNELQNILVSIKSLGSDEEEFSKRVDDRASPKSEVPLTYTQDSWEQSNGGNGSIEQNSKSDRSAYLVNMDPIESASNSSSMRSRSFPPSSPRHQEAKATNEQKDESGITFQRELLKANNHEPNMTFSFRNIFQDPKNDLYECRAPSGPLGIVVDTTPLGPRVRSLNPLSPIFGKVSPGDVIVGVDDVDTVGMEAGNFWKIASRKANQQTRTLTILRI